ncbi:DUF397 domain-containing protein [Streptomyces sp. ACA25]|nr:DUF397 domain-containing protein [Streptomyces sp. ACA25]MDB1087778.1 DUF397 domain-containing protein [Streptomyces sp. ACA25]
MRFVGRRGCRRRGDGYEREQGGGQSGHGGAESATHALPPVRAAPGADHRYGRVTTLIIRSVDRHHAAACCKSTTCIRTKARGAEFRCGPEVADGIAGLVPVRDSKAPEGPASVIPAAGWGPCRSAVKGGAL